MDFAWSLMQQELRDGILDMAQGLLNSGLRERDANSEFNHEGWLHCARAGVLGLPFPEEYGGMGLDSLTTVGVLERLGYGCKDNGLTFSINAHMWTAQIPILQFGNEEQKIRWLPGLCSGELIGGNAMTEPDSGSDAYSLATRARRDGEDYVLDGSKVYISNGGIADLLVVYANVDDAGKSSGITAFVVEKGTPGFSVIGKADKMGIRTSPMASLYFDECRIPVENRLGSEGDGISIFTNSMTWERSCILASAVGTMARLLETSVRYAKSRKQFGQSIGRFQSISSRIVDMKVRLETSRNLLYRTAWLRDQGRSAFSEAAMTKLYLSESWVQCAENAMHIHGGFGYMKDSEMERELRDAMASRIYSGTSEIQRMLIASLMGL